MTLKKQLIKDFEELTPEELIAVQAVIHALARKPVKSVKSGRATGYLQARKALAGCAGNLSDDIMKERENRV